jgi:hypothetical protein
MKFTIYNKSNTLFNNYTFDKIKSNQIKNNNFDDTDFNKNNNIEEEEFKDDYNYYYSNFKTKNKLLKTIGSYANIKNNNYLYNLINKYQNETSKNENEKMENEKKNMSNNININESNMNNINFNNINIGINNNNFIIEENMNKAFKTYNNSFNKKINDNNEDRVDFLNKKEDSPFKNKNNTKIYINKNKRNKSQISKFIYKTEGNKSAYTKKNNIKLNLQYDNNINTDGTTHKHDYFLSGYIPKINKLYYKKKTINCHTYENDHHGTSNEIINSLKTYSIKDKKKKYYIYNNFLDGDDIKENIDNNIDYNQILATKNNNMNKEMFKYIKKEIDSNKNSYNYHNKLENIKTRITDLLDFYNILLTKKLSNQNL